MKKISLRNRLIFWLMFIGIIPLLIVLILVFVHNAETIRQEETEGLKTIRNLKLNRLHDWIHDREGDISVIAGDFEIRSLEYVFSGGMGTKTDSNILYTAQRLLKRYKESYDDYSEIFILHSDNGKVMLSSDQDNIGKIKAQRPYFREALRKEQVFFQDVHRSPATGEIQMIISAPVYCMTHNEHLIGVVVCRIDLYANLYPLLLDRSGLGDTGESLIVDSLGYALNKLRHYDNAPLNLRIEATPAQMAIEGKTGIIEEEDYRGVPVMAAYTWLPDMNWGFVVKQDRRELFKPVKSILTYLIIVILITGILVFLLAILVGRSVINPLISLRNTAEQMAGGDLSVRNREEKYTETASLSDSFNSMASGLQSRSEIQEKINLISSSLIGREDMALFAERLTATLLDTSGSQFISFYYFDDGQETGKCLASQGLNRSAREMHLPGAPEGEINLALSTGEIQHITLPDDKSRFRFVTTAGELIPSEILAIPVTVAGKVSAVISAGTVNKFSPGSIDAVKQSIKIINNAWTVQLINERTRQLASDLKKANEILESQKEELHTQAEELHSQSEELQKQSDELRSQNMSLQQKTVEVREANRLKSEFLANMSHELRTPLNSILALTGVLTDQAKDKLDSDEYKYLEVVQRNGANLLKLINEILDLSKIESGKVDLLPRKIALKPMISSVCESVAPLAKEKGIKIIRKTEEKLPGIVTDESRLQQVLTNIINNAVKFTEKGEVTVSALQKSEQIIIRVEDTGIGIPEESLKYIFDEFRQLDGSTARKFGGTGLGLAIVKKLVDMLGGKISVQSKPGEGTVFTLIFPLNWKKEKPDPKIKPDVSDKKAESPAPSQTSLENRTILIVEDNEAAIIQMKSVLENEGVKVDIARNGGEAIEFLQNSKPDGILMDLMMPEVDGFRTIQHIKESDKTEKIPILVMTAKDLTKEDMEFFDKYNVHQLIQKGNIDIEGFKEKVQQILQQHVEAEKPDTVSTKKTNAINKAILIIEDNPDNMLTVKAILQDKYHLLEAVDGEQGLQIALEEQPGLILMDIALPGMDGFELIKELKSNATTASIPVIAVTAMVMKGDREKILKAGCDEYLSKPVNTDRLLSAISSFLK
ncbi:MAG: response regulator [Bacteroidales bacterium]|nr:response regulator [Bacteroidales bacterium]